MQLTDALNSFIQRQAAYGATHGGSPGHRSQKGSRIAAMYGPPFGITPKWSVSGHDDIAVAVLVAQ